MRGTDICKTIMMNCPLKLGRGFNPRPLISVQPAFMMKPYGTEKATSWPQSTTSKPLFLPSTAPSALSPLIQPLSLPDQGETTMAFRVGQKVVCVDADPESGF